MITLTLREKHVLSPTSAPGRRRRRTTSDPRCLRVLYYVPNHVIPITQICPAQKAGGRTVFIVTFGLNHALAALHGGE